jgi:hypothetical protein
LLKEGKGSSISYPSEHLGIILTVEKYREHELKISVTLMKKEEKRRVFFKKKYAGRRMGSDFI